MYATVLYSKNTMPMLALIKKLIKGKVAAYAACVACAASQLVACPACLWRPRRPQRWRCSRTGSPASRPSRTASRPQRPRLTRPWKKQENWLQLSGYTVVKLCPHGEAMAQWKCTIKLIIWIDQQSTLIILLSWPTFPLSGKWVDFLDYKKLYSQCIIFCF